MNQALISLMEKQTFDSITIKALCEKAGINRSTFYSHYQNLTELLEGGCTESIPYICDLIRFCILGPLQPRTNHDKIEKTVRAEI